MDINGTLNAAANAINVSGDWDMYASGTFSSTGTVTLDGSSTDQMVTTGNKAFYNLTLNNSGSAGDDDIIIAD